MGSTWGVRSAGALVLTTVGWLGSAAPASAHHGHPLGGTVTGVPAPSTPPTTVFRPALGAATPTTTAPQPVAAGATYQEGATGPNIKVIEQRLDALQYFVGTIDEKYDSDTAQAVTAFQKVNGLSRTGKVDAGVWNAMAAAKPPAPLVPGGGGHRVEIDLNRQVLFLYEGGKLAKILAVSSGTPDTPTPTGDYAVYYQTSGWETSALGQLYNSQYFVGGYAIHGSKSVPAQPASHGCVRIPMTAADWLPSHLSIGTPVYIR